jgi:hypothetical protein
MSEDMVECAVLAMIDINESSRGLKYSDLMRAMAIAAISALREPTEEMVKRGDQILPACVEEVWQAMIDAALGKKEG